MIITIRPGWQMCSCLYLQRSLPSAIDDITKGNNLCHSLVAKVPAYFFPLFCDIQFTFRLQIIATTNCISFDMKTSLTLSPILFIHTCQQVYFMLFYRTTYFCSPGYSPDSATLIHFIYFVVTPKLCQFHIFYDSEEN